MEKYDKLFEQYKNACTEMDNEYVHIMQDKITEKFVMDVAGGKLTGNQKKNLQRSYN
jgi:hypothetical protein